MSRSKLLINTVGILFLIVAIPTIIFIFVNWYDNETMKCISEGHKSTTARIYSVDDRKNVQGYNYIFYDLNGKHHKGSISLTYDFKVGDTLGIIYCTDDPEHHFYIKEYEEKITKTKEDK